MFWASKLLARGCGLARGARTFSLNSVETSTLKQFNEFSPKITVIGVGGAGCNAVNNMILSNALHGVDFVGANTDAQHLSTTLAGKKIQLGRDLTKGLGCGADHLIGKAAAEESKDEILDAIRGTHLAFIVSGMGGGTGTGAAPAIAELCYEQNVLTIAIVTKPFAFEGNHRNRLAMDGVRALHDRADVVIVVPNQNLFNVVDQKTSFVDAFKVADAMMLEGVKGITDLIIRPGLINVDFADVRAIVAGMGTAIVGTGVAEGENRAVRAAELALNNPLLGESGAIKSAKGCIVNVSGGADLTLFEVDKAAQHILSEIEDQNANIIFGSTTDDSLDGSMRVSVVATGVDSAFAARPSPQ